MSEATSVDPSTSRWTARETELLAVTLQLLQQHGYNGLTVDAVALQAKASKATVYRRWPSKADLVLAAFIEGTRVAGLPPNTGSLRGDLLALGTTVRRQACEHGSTMRAVLNEMSHSPRLREAMQHEFIDQRRLVMASVLAEALARNEIDASAINDEIYDLLPGYLVFRSLVSPRPPTDETVRILVDDVLLPSLGYRGPESR